MRISRSFEWEYFITNSNVDEGNFITLNGLEFAGGCGADDVDYLGFEARLKF